MYEQVSQTNMLTLNKIKKSIAIQGSFAQGLKLLERIDAIYKEVINFLARTCKQACQPQTYSTSN